MVHACFIGRSGVVLGDSIFIDFYSQHVIIILVENKSWVKEEGAERYGIWLMKQGKLTAQEYEMGLLKAKRMIEEFEGT